MSMDGRTNHDMHAAKTAVVLVGCAMAVVAAAAARKRLGKRVNGAGLRRTAKKRKRRGYNLREEERIRVCATTTAGDSPSGEPTAECGWKSMVDDFVSAACVPSRISFHFVVEFEGAALADASAFSDRLYNSLATFQFKPNARRGVAPAEVTRLRRLVRSAACHDDGTSSCAILACVLARARRRTLLSLAETPKTCSSRPRFNLHVLLPDNVGFRDKMAQRCRAGSSRIVSCPPCALAMSSWRGAPRTSPVFSAALHGATFLISSYQLRLPSTCPPTPTYTKCRPTSRRASARKESACHTSHACILASASSALLCPSRPKTFESSMDRSVWSLRACR